MNKKQQKIYDNIANNKVVVSEESFMEIILPQKAVGYIDEKGEIVVGTLSDMITRLNTMYMGKITSHTNKLGKTKFTISKTPLIKRKLKELKPLIEKNGGRTKGF